MYLDGNGGTSNPSDVFQKSASTSNNQQWSQETSGSYVKFKNRATGLYIDGLGSGTNGAVLGQWSTSSSQNQEWTITTVGTSARQSSQVISENKPEELGINLYPNPFVTSFSLAIPKPGEQLQIIIFDAMGREVETIAHSGASNTLLLGAALKPGFYLVRVNGVNWSQTFKILKQ